MNGTPQAWTPTQLEDLARAKLHAAIRDQHPDAAASMARELYRLLQQHHHPVAAPQEPQPSDPLDPCEGHPIYPSPQEPTP